MDTLQKKILVVDDDEFICGYLCDFLAKLNYGVYSVRDGDECWNLLNRLPIDIVITDLIMPKVEGIETIIRIRKQFPDIRIIAMSGVAFQNNYLMLAQELGAKATLSKPFVGTDIMGALQKIGEPVTVEHER